MLKGHILVSFDDYKLFLIRFSLFLLISIKSRYFFDFFNNSESSFIVLNSFSLIFFLIKMNTLIFQKKSTFLNSNNIIKSESSKNVISA